MEEDRRKKIEREEVDTRKKETSDVEPANGNGRNIAFIVIVTVAVVSLLLLGWSIWRYGQEKKLRLAAEQELSGLKRSLRMPLVQEGGDAFDAEEALGDFMSITKKGDSVVSIIKRQLESPECRDKLMGASADDTACRLAKEAGYIKSDGTEIRLGTEAIGKLAIRLECRGEKIALREYLSGEEGRPLKIISLGEGRENEANEYEYLYMAGAEEGFDIDLADFDPAKPSNLVLRVEVSCQAQSDDSGFLDELHFEERS